MLLRHASRLKHQTCPVNTDAKISSGDLHCMLSAFPLSHVRACSLSLSLSHTHTHSLSLSLFLSLSLSLFLFLSLSLSLSLSVSLSVSLSLCLCLSLSVCVCLSLARARSLSLPACVRPCFYVGHRNRRGTRTMEERPQNSSRKFKTAFTDERDEGAIRVSTFFLFTCIFFVDFCFFFTVPIGRETRVFRLGGAAAVPDKNMCRMCHGVSIFQCGRRWGNEREREREREKCKEGKHMQMQTWRAAGTLYISETMCVQGLVCEYTSHATHHTVDSGAGLTLHRVRVTPMCEQV